MSNDRMLTQEEIKALDARLTLRTDELIKNRNKFSMGNKKSNTGKQPEILMNEHRSLLEDVWYTAQLELAEARESNPSARYSFLPTMIDDAVVGMCRVDFNPTRKIADKPLSISRIMKVLTSLDDISVRSISNLLMIDRSNAQKYFRAIKLGYPLLNNNLEFYMDILDEKALANKTVDMSPVNNDHMVTPPVDIPNCGESEQCRRCDKCMTNYLKGIKPTKKNLTNTEKNHPYDVKGL